MEESQQLSPLGQRLRRFNRKERFWLLENVLTDFSKSIISKNFQSELEKKLKIKLPKKGLYWALDYHFDWIYAALSSNEDLDDNVEYENSKDFKIRGTQQDIDFLICFDKTLILIEAKGVTKWDSMQLNLKKNRILEIEKYLSNKENYNIFFVLISPREINKENNPLIDESSKVRPLNIKMNIDQDLVYVRRCHKNGGDYKKWKIIPQK